MPVEAPKELGLDWSLHFRDTTPMVYGFQPIGIIRSCFVERFGTPRQGRLIPSATATLQIRSDLNPQQILEGLDKCSHIWLIFVFHKNLNTKGRPKVHPPLLNGESLGVFATRTPHRPNPIGLSVVKVERVEGDTIFLSGIDVIDGTPVLDIKPYIRSHDLVEEAEDSYISERPWNFREVLWSAEALNDFSCVQIPPGQTSESVQRLINDVLAIDPRSSTDKSDPGRRPHYFITLFDVNVQFVFENDRIIVTMVENRSRIDPRNYPRTRVGLQDSTIDS